MNCLEREKGTFHYIQHELSLLFWPHSNSADPAYLEALKDEIWDCFIFHDVDLVPENDLNLYRCEDQPRHLVVGRNSTGYR